MFINQNGVLFNFQYFDLFQKKGLLSFDALWNQQDHYFCTKKRYRIVSAYQINGSKIFIKKYLAHIEEAKKEWENIFLLWSKGFPTSVPVFFTMSQDKRAMIGTEEVNGEGFLEIVQNDSSKTAFLISKIAKFLAEFHITGLFHQDCYLNHFYYNKNLDQLIVIDISRVKYNPFFSKYFFIKDLAQLKFSFYTYFQNEALNFWNIFWENYNNEFKNSLFLAKLIDLKVRLIKRHTDRVLKRGGEI